MGASLAAAARAAWQELAVFKAWRAPPRARASGRA
jgi:hypothetical protein